MARSQSAGGSSLSSIYDTKGSALAPSAEIMGQEIALTHDMGALLFAEAYRVQVVRLAATSISQSSNFEATTDDLPASPFRVMGFVVFSQQGSDSFVTCSLNIRDRDDQMEVPIFIWEFADGQSTVRFEPGDPFGVAGYTVLNQAPGNISQQTQYLMQGTKTNPDGTLGVSSLSLRGSTDSFGAGTAGIHANIVIASANAPGSGALANRGLPLPGW